MHLLFTLFLVVFVHNPGTACAANELTSTSEWTHHRLSKQEIQYLHHLRANSPSQARYSHHQKTRTFLMCLSADADYWASSSAAGCIDAQGQTYYLLSGGVGFTIGVSLSAFGLLYVSYDDSNVEGVYGGGSFGYSTIPLGTNYGVFLKESENQRRNELYLLGVTTGAGIDISAALLTITRATDTKDKPTASSGDKNEVSSGASN